MIRIIKWLARELQMAKKLRCGRSKNSVVVDTVPSPHMKWFWNLLCHLNVILHGVLPTPYCLAQPILSLPTHTCRLNAI